MRIKANWQHRNFNIRRYYRICHLNMNKISPQFLTETFSLRSLSFSYSVLSQVPWWTLFLIPTLDMLLWPQIFSCSFSVHILCLLPTQSQPLLWPEIQHPGYAHPWHAAMTSNFFLLLFRSHSVPSSYTISAAPVALNTSSRLMNPEIFIFSLDFSPELQTHIFIVRLIYASSP